MKVKAIDWAEFERRGPEFVKYWRARKRADQFCIPYEEYLSFAFHFASRRKRRYDPQVNQLHGGPKSKDVWLMLFAERIRERLWPSLLALDTPQFHADHFVDLEPQRDYREFVLAVCATSSLVSEPWKRLIERYSYRRNEIPAELFKDFVAPESHSEWTADLECDFAQGRLGRAPAVHLDSDEFCLSCFGLPGCFDETAKMCLACPLLSSCQRAGRGIESKVRAATGSADPADEARRNRQNERKARSRAKLASSGAGSSS